MHSSHRQVEIIALLVYTTNSYCTARISAKSRESAWDDKSPFSVLRTSSSIGRRSGSAIGHASTPSTSAARTASQTVLRVQNDSPQLHQHVNSIFGQTHASGMEDGAINYAAPGVRSLAEVEAEMRASSQRAREAREQELLRQQEEQQQQLQQQQLLLLQQQQQLQLQQQQQQQMRPPRMRSDSPSVLHAQSLQANQRIANSPDAMLQQRRLVHEMEAMTIQEANRHVRKESANMPIHIHNSSHVDSLDGLNMAEIEHMLQQGVPQHRIEELLASQNRRQQRLMTPDEMSQELQRQIALDQRRQAQIAAAGLVNQRGSPMDHQLRMALANEMALRARAEAMNMQSANQAEIAQLQMRQRMIAQLAEQDLSHQSLLANGVNGQGMVINGRTQEALLNEANRKIMEAEQMERKRRRKLEKIAHMVSISYATSTSVS